MARRHGQEAAYMSSVAAEVEQMMLPLRWEEHFGTHWWYATPLDYAAARGYVDAALKLMRADDAVRELTSLKRLRRLEALWDDECRLGAAPARGRAAVARALMSALGRVAFLDAGLGAWALYCAAAASDVATVHALLRARPCLVFGDRDYALPDVLYAAARSSSADIFGAVLRCAAKRFPETPPSPLPGAPGAVSATCLGVADVPVETAVKALHACAAGSVRLLRTLLADLQRAGVSASEWVTAAAHHRGATAVHVAAARGRVAAMQVLAAVAPAALWLRDCGGNHAVHVAAHGGHWQLLEWLAGCSPSAVADPNAEGNTPLHLAVWGLRRCGFRSPEPHLRTVDRLLALRRDDCGGLARAPNRYGRTALHVALMPGRRPSESAVEALLAAGAYPHAPDFNGDTPIDLARAAVFSGAADPVLLRRLLLAASDTRVWRMRFRGGREQNSCGASSSSFSDDDDDDLDSQMQIPTLPSPSPLHFSFPETPTTASTRTMTMRGTSPFEMWSGASDYATSPENSAFVVGPSRWSVSPLPDMTWMSAASDTDTDMSEWTSRSRSQSQPWPPPHQSGNLRCSSVPMLESVAEIEREHESSGGGGSTVATEQVNVGRRSKRKPPLPPLFANRAPSPFF